MHWRYNYNTKDNTLILVSITPKGIQSGLKRYDLIFSQWNLSLENIDHRTGFIRFLYILAVLKWFALNTSQMYTNYFYKNKRWKVPN